MDSLFAPRCVLVTGGAGFIGVNFVRWLLETDPNVQIVVTMDGFGPPALKLAQYRSYVHDQGVAFSGIKLFYHHDVPLLTPPQVLGLDPSPDLVIYQ